jgi:hypothetical protein
LYYSAKKTISKRQEKEQNEEEERQRQELENKRKEKEKRRKAYEDSQPQRTEIFNRESKLGNRLTNIERFYQKK